MMSISGSGGRSELDTASRVVAQMPTSGMGQKTEVSGLARHIRFTLRCRHRQPAPACPFGPRTDIGLVARKHYADRMLWNFEYSCRSLGESKGALKNPDKTTRNQPDC
jgi:hypothetical protein